MTALAFFLYDNKTWTSRWGPDWGLKAATGALADRPDLKARFDRYCAAMPDEQGQLRGFGAAIGGMRPEWGNGYLLCVTLESSDSFGRPSWAAVGLWCPDAATLQEVLTAGDPIGSARAVLGRETPPSALQILPATRALAAAPDPSAPPAWTVRRFDPRATVSEVTVLLLATLQAGAPLPNVLGISATTRPTARGAVAFHRVYCHPMDERSARALARVLSDSSAGADEPWLAPADPRRLAAPGPASHTAATALPKARTAFRRWWTAGGLAAAPILFLLQGGAQPADPSTPHPASPPTREETPAVASGSVAASPAPQQGLARDALDEIGERLAECRRLVPEALRQSPAFVAAETTDVLPAYQARRDQVRRAFAALLEIRARVVGRRGNYVAYYFDESGRQAPSAARLQKIAAIFKEAPLGAAACKTLKEAFGFEFESGASELRRWCDSFARLERTAARTLHASSGE
jgi:hypothetical protein